MTGFQTDAATLASAAKHVHDVSESVKSQTQLVVGNATDLRTAWQGVASNAFGTLIDSYSREAANLDAALKEIAGMLDKSGVTYSTTDDDQLQAMNAITNALG